MTMEQQEFTDRMMKNVETKGLTDVKFLDRNASSLTTEEFFAAANRMERAVDEGKSIPGLDWDSAIPQTVLESLAY